jgi:proteasome accessory factor PafA2
VAIPKVCGIETEYGILHRGTGGEANPITASSLLINAYINTHQRRFGWDFEDESPGNDARGFSKEGSLPPEIETHLVNTVLTNGARYYVDHAHPEYSSPESRTALEATLYDKAGEAVISDSMSAVRTLLPPEQEIVIYKNNSDGKGNSYGCHENYLMDRAVPFAQIVQHIMPFFVTRQVFCGAGKVGCEATPRPQEEVNYQISQRADFFEEEVGLETTLKRPIVNTRDEPHADSQKYRRLHVIIGDANMSEYATFLKLGTTSLILCAIEDGFFADRDFTLSTPVAAVRRVSYDPTLKYQLDFNDGRQMNAVQLQWEYFDVAKKYAEEQGFEAVGEESGRLVLQEWERVLNALETDPTQLADCLDWVAKYQLVSSYRERHDLQWKNAKLSALDIQYHDLRAEKSLFSKLTMRKVVDQSQIEMAKTEPPRDTRAYFRGKCLQKWPNAIAAANWDSIVFDLGDDPLRRVPMMEPLRGTAEVVDRLFEECATPNELLTLLGA